MNNEAFEHRIAIAQRFAQRMADGDAVFLEAAPGIVELPHTVSDGQKRHFCGANAFMLLQVMKDRGWQDSRFFTVDQIAQSGWALSPDARSISLQFLIATGEDGLPLEHPEVRRFRVFNARDIHGVPPAQINPPVHEADLAQALAETGFSLDGSAELSHCLAACMLGIDARLPIASSVPASKAAAWANAIQANPMSFFEAAQAGQNLAASVMRQVRLASAERETAAAIQKAAAGRVEGSESVEIKTKKGVAIVRKASARIEALFQERQAVLNVPYEEKKQASALGAVWYPTQSFWFVPKGVPLERFDKWNPQKQSLGLRASTQEVLDAFADEMVKLGLVVDKEIEADGEWHSVPVTTKRKIGRNKSGSYILSMDGSRDGGPIGTILNKDTGQQFTWKYHGPALTPEQRARLNAEIKEREAQAERKLLATQNEAAAIAKEIFAKGTPADQHGYVLKKGISAQGLRQVPGSLLMAYDCFKSEEGKTIIRANEKYLLIPLSNEAGELRAVQAISGDGAVKTFMRGAQKSGLMHVLGAPSFAALVEQSEKPHAIAYVEGYATGSSFHEDTGMPVVVCFDAGNLETVVTKTAALFPSGTQRILAVDNDQFFVERATGFLERHLGINPHAVNGQTLRVADGRHLRDVAVGEMHVDGKWHETPKGTYCASIVFDEGKDAVRSLSIEVVPNQGGKVASMFGNRGVEAGRTAMAGVAELVAKGKAAAVNTVLAVPEFKDLRGRPTDFNDLRVREGKGSVRALMQGCGVVAVGVDVPKIAVVREPQVVGLER